MNILSNILITAIVSTLSIIGAYKYIPLSWVDSTNSYGSSITTIQGSDTLSSSRTTINDNFTSLNNGKIEVGSTTINAITSLPNLATLGTIGSGIWNGTAIGVLYGGTGTTTPTINQIMIGNGSSGFKVIGFGTSGQFLTSNGNAAEPSWTTSALDLTANYIWTGQHTFASSTTYTQNVGIVNATSTIRINGVDVHASADLQVFTSSGTWTKPVGATKVLVESWGGGGSGAKSTAGGAPGNSSGGGGGGEYKSKWFNASDLGSTETVTIGDGGASQTSAGNPGNNGGNTTFGSLLTAYGGSGGGYGNAGNSTGGSGGTSISLFDNYGLYGIGVNGTTGGSGLYSGAGGGSNGSSGTEGAGGNSVYGGGGGGGVAGTGSASGGSSEFGGSGGASQGGSGNATNGAVPGGGGGGKNTSGGAGDSGAGAKGKMIITSFY